MPYDELRSWYDLVQREGQGRRRGFPGSFYATSAGAFKPDGYLGMANQRTDLLGPELVRFLRRGSKHLLAVTVNGSPIQLAENRVTVDPERRDDQGMALAHVEHSFARQDLTMHEAMRKEARDILEVAGARDVVSPQAITIHIFGGAVMGDEPRRSVTNGYGAVHGVRNLFVAGSNLFPMGRSREHDVHAPGARRADRGAHAARLGAADVILRVAIAVGAVVWVLLAVAAVVVVGATDETPALAGVELTSVQEDGRRLFVDNSSGCHALKVTASTLARWGSSWTGQPDAHVRRSSPAPADVRAVPPTPGGHSCTTPSSVEPS